MDHQRNEEVILLASLKSLNLSMCGLLLINMREKSEDREMNTRVRTALQTVKAASKHNKVMEREKRVEMQGKAPLNRIQSRRERKITLQQDVDKLKKRLRHEENVHRALERAFTRPLGALPRLPPFLPSHTLELLAEVAVLEEEVVRLEEQVVNFRQGLYQEAVYISSSKKPSENPSNLQSDKYPSQNSKAFGNSNVAIASKPSPSMRWPSNGYTNLKKPIKKANLDDRHGKENQVNSNSSKTKQSPGKKVSSTRITDYQRISDESAVGEDSGPNKLSEDILNCLMRIYSQISSTNDTEPESLPSISGSSDPYDICSEFGRRDIGPYKHFVLIEPSSTDLNLTASSSMLARKLKIFLRKLALVDLSGLTHQQKLAFWINIYNSCMMNAFLEQSIQTTPQMIVALMPKAMINVGGHLIRAMTIEHFILRLPYRSKNTCPKGLKSDEITTRGDFGLDWPEPLVTFALSCGSWSSPAVRIYTACQVDKQLETAKREYLQAAIGISIPNKLAIPKLLDWYLLDFAKDVESLMDWICLQLPSKVRNDAVTCIERGRSSEVRQAVQVLPYEFRFRYILAT